MSSKAGRLSFGEKTGYACGDVASNLFFQTFMLFLLYFYTDVFGISALAAGTMFLVTRIWDTINDPLMGMIADRTRTKWGRFRPYLLWMAFPFGVCGVLTFTTPDLGPTGKLVYAYATYTGMMMAYTAINIPYSALMGVVSPNSLQRTALSSFRFIGAFAGGLIVKAGTGAMVQFFGQGNEATGYQMAMSVYAVAAVVLFLITFASTKERVQPLPTQKTSLGRDLRDLARNRPWIVLFFLGLFTLCSVSIRYAVLIFYFEYCVGSKEWFGYFLAFGGIANIVGVAIVPWLSRILGKRLLYGVLMGISSVLIVGFYFISPQDLVMVFVVEILINLVMGPTSPLVWAMYADSADYSEWKTGRRATGLVFSAATFAQKMGWTVGGTLAGWLLAFYGYQANVPQSAETLAGIRLMVSFIPAVGAALAAVTVLVYKLDESLMKRIEKELAARRDEKGEKSEDQEAPADA